MLVSLISVSDVWHWLSETHSVEFERGYGKMSLKQIAVVSGVLCDTIACKCEMSSYFVVFSCHGI